MDEVTPFLKIVSLTFFALFPVINPIGTSFIVRAMVVSLPESEHRKLVLRVASYTTLFLLILLVLGVYILKLFGLSISSVQIGGGLVLAAIGWRILNDDDTEHKENTDTASEIIDDVSGKEFYPMTFPITTGPGALSVILTISAHSTASSIDSTIVHYAAAAIGVVLMGVCIYYLFIYLPKLATGLSQAGLKALSKILAFVIVCIGVDILLDGINSFLGK